MIAKVYSIVPVGFAGTLVEVEGDKNHGLPAFNIVGMANKTVNEARDRVKSALLNSGFTFPIDRITINLAPADLHKDSPGLDLPIALAILLLSNQLLPKDLVGRIFVGELSLEGAIRPVSGIINIVEAAKALGFKEVFLPLPNLPQASLISGIKLVGISSLLDLLLILKGQATPNSPPKPVIKKLDPSPSQPVLDDINGQALAKRALAIAVAGHHNILLSGPPGAGKTLLAKTAISLLPDLTPEEQIPLTKLYSLLSSDGQIVSRRPFRSPHHSASLPSIIGGGATITPGEISLAHLGVLFLDELPEYPRTTLESLRQPLEDHEITITRAKNRVTFPADFMLIATMNPCPCGFYGDPTKTCTCSPFEIKNYQKKLSGPLLDRIDILINVQKVPTSSLAIHNQTSTTEHSVVKNKVLEAIARQRTRYQDPYTLNSSLSSAELSKFAQLEPAAEKLLRSAADSLELSARSFFKTIKVAHTIADFEGSIPVKIEHISEALSYRLDQTKNSFIIGGKPKKTLARTPKV